MVAPKPLAGLAPDRDPWDRQPGETDRSYGQFAIYRDQGRRRTLAQTAEFLTLNANHVRQVAAAKLWRKRAEAWDREQDRVFCQEMADKRRELVKDEAKIAGAFLSKIIPRLRRVSAGEMDKLNPVELGRMMELTMRLMRDAYGVPDKMTTAATVQQDLEQAQTAAVDVEALSDPEKLAALRSWNQEIADFLDFAEETRVNHTD